MHKICLCCGKMSGKEAAYCGECGEASFIDMNDFPMREPSLQIRPAVEDKPKPRGRK